MIDANLSSDEIIKVKELCAQVHISSEDAITCLKGNEWDVSLASKQASECLNSILPCSSKDAIYDGEARPSRSSPRHVPGYAFYLPDLENLPTEFRLFLEKDLIETPTQRRLEASRHLNWWTNFGQRLYPLSTTGDGNCLLHAASLGMWGLHDRQLTLRETLYEMLVNGSRRSALWRRWKWSEHNAIHSSELALTLSEEEWQQEWDGLIALASPVPRKQEDSESDSTDQIYESLETIHVFALAHVLKRPIVVVADTVLRNAKGEELSPVSFGGIYLPLECAPDQCHRSPLVLCYDSAHFSPLVPMRSDNSLQLMIPIVDANRNLLPVHFAIDPGPDFTWWRDDADSRIAAQLTMTESDKLSLISEYMDVVRLDVRRGSVRSTRRVRSTHSAETNCREDQKGLTLASSGVSSGRQDKRRILNEITQQLLRSLRLSNGKRREKFIDAVSCVISMNKSSCVLAAQIVASSHEYMDDMVKEYMKSAKLRFHQSAKTRSASNDGRKRISRSFSASSLMITCINSNCQQPASQATNFLCDDCFAEQKLLLMSFNCERPSLLRRAPVSTNVAQKSTTMPLLQPKEPSVIIAPVLGITCRDGSSTTSSVHAVRDADGVTHYYVGNDDQQSTA